MHPGIISVSVESDPSRSTPVQDDDSNDVGNSPESSLETYDRNLKRRSRRFRGLVFSLIASLSLAINTAVSKAVIENYNAFFISLVRLQGIFLPCLAFVLYEYMKKGNIFDRLFPFTAKANRSTVLAVIGRGICGAIVSIFLVSSVKYISVGDTIVIKSCSPLLVALFAGCCLNESVRVVTILCGIQIILGVCCIAKPPFLTGQETYDLDVLIGTMVAFVLAVAASLGVICMRYSRKIHFALPSLSTGMIGSLASGILCWITQGFEWPKSGQDLLYFFALASCTTVTQILATLALKYDKAGYTALVRTSEICFAFSLEIFVSKKMPDQFSSIGALIVLLAVIIAVVSKQPET